MPYMFEDAESVPQLLRMIVGAASMCWENVDGAGLFDHKQARKIAEEGLDCLRNLTGLALRDG